MFDKLNMGELSKAFEEIQKRATEIQEESEKKRFTAISGGGLVSVTANGKGEIIDIDIDDSLLEDNEALQILLISAINDVFKMVEEDKQRSALNLMGSGLFGK